MRFTLIKLPNPILREKAKLCIIDDAFRARLGEIEEFIWQIPKHLGQVAGLAAPQIGISERFFFMLDKWYINPEIVWTPSAPLKNFEEGCFSLEDGRFNYKTERHYSIRVKYQDTEGIWHEERLKGFEAQCFQHELDHLNGILCCDYEHNPLQTI